MVLFWPHAHENIFFSPFTLVLESFSYGFGPPFLLHNGEILGTHEVPKSYILVNLFQKGNLKTLIQIMCSLELN